MGSPVGQLLTNDPAVPATQTAAPFSFVADRPFFLAIRDHSLKELLFVGAIRSRGIPLVVNLAGGYTSIAERLHLMTVRVMAAS